MLKACDTGLEFYLPYAATSNPENVGRLIRSVSQQRQLDRQVGADLGHVKCLFTDKAERLPHEVAEFFNGGVFETQSFVKTPTGTRFCLAMLRNAAIRHGRDISAEWTMLCDSDTIINPAAFPEPTSRFCMPNVYYQRHAEETAFDSLVALQNSNVSLFADGNSWFVLNRELLSRFEFNEEFTGYGWQDNEFRFRVMGAGYQLDVVDVTVIHSFHTTGERKIDPVVNAHNKAMATGVRWLIENGVLDARKSPPKLEIVDVVHPRWQSQIALCPQLELMVRFNPRSMCRYEVNGETYRFFWPFQPPGVFRKLDGRLVEIGLFKEHCGTVSIEAGGA